MVAVTVVTTSKSCFFPLLIRMFEEKSSTFLFSQRARLKLREKEKEKEKKRRKEEEEGGASWQLSGVGVLKKEQDMRHFSFFVCVVCCDLVFMSPRRLYLLV